MAENHTFNVPAHPNIYTGSTGRELRIEFSIPSAGVQANTGFIILVPGFGATIDSNVYQKMREQFAELYNAVTIQCEYFGSAHMQSADKISIPNEQALRSILSEAEWNHIQQNPGVFTQLIASKEVTFPVKADLSETVEDFNDMGYMQAIDIITAFETVKLLLDDNKLEYDVNRVIGYGHSHGSYLLHLCNVISPQTFSFIVDNSAWIEPLYIDHYRVLYKGLGKGTLAIHFDYLAKKVLRNKSLLNLSGLYQAFQNQAKIISFMGVDDRLVKAEEKEQFISNIPNADFILVTKDDVDMVKYKSTSHGLDADFLELFSYALQFENYEERITKRELQYEINYKTLKIQADFTQGLPIFTFDFEAQPQSLV